MDDENLIPAIEACRICARDFADTTTAHEPRPVVWFSKQARILIAGQAPGIKVHQSGRPFTDPSGDRLREWLGLEEQVFFDKERIAIVPMALCFPGYNDKGADLPPPKRCAENWRQRIMASLPKPGLTLLVGGYAQKWHLEKSLGVATNVRNWRETAPNLFCLPHPSWRNNAWLTNNPWFEQELLPALRTRVAEVLDGQDGTGRG